MPLGSSAKLEKLKINAYKDIERKHELDHFVAMFNPASLQKSYQTVYRKRQSINSIGRTAKFSFIPPSELKLKLVIDGSYMAAYSSGEAKLLKNSGIDVDERVESFKKTAYYLNGDIHQPNFLRIFWGDISYDCRLVNHTINYTSFNQNGKVQRAEIEAAFIHETDDSKRAAIAGKNSPDLTHKRIVKAGDTLPLMTKDIYGSPDYYLQIAAINELNDFRNLIPGQEIYFPPIDKSE